MRVEEYSDGVLVAVSGLTPDEVVALAGSMGLGTPQLVVRVAAEVGDDGTVTDTTETPVDRIVAVDGWEPPSGHTVVDEADWTGDQFSGPSEDDDARKRRTRVERLAASLDQVGKDMDRRDKDNATLALIVADLDAASTVAKLRSVVSDLADLYGRALTREKRTERGLKRALGMMLDVIDDTDTDED